MGMTMITRQFTKAKAKSKIQYFETCYQNNHVLERL